MTLEDKLAQMKASLSVMTREFALIDKLGESIDDGEVDIALNELEAALKRAAHMIAFTQRNCADHS